MEKEIGRVMAHVGTKVRDASKEANIQDITTFKKKVVIWVGVII
jgi:hypothetical protein